MDSDPQQTLQGFVSLVQYTDAVFMVADVMYTMGHVCPLHLSTAPWMQRQWQIGSTGLLGRPLLNADSCASSCFSAINCSGSS